MGVDVDVGDAVDVGEEDLPVPDHVGDDKADDDDARHGHDPLLANRRSIELDRPRGLLRLCGGGHDLTL